MDTWRGATTDGGIGGAIVELVMLPESGAFEAVDDGTESTGRPLIIVFTGTVGMMVPNSACK